MKSIDHLVRPGIRNLKPYQSARSLMQGEDYILLDANENPYGKGINRYPDPYQQELKQAISAMKGIPARNMVLGNGSDEVIDMLIRALVEPGKDNVIVHEPGFSMYEVYTNLQGGNVRKVQLNESFQPDLRTFQEQVDEHTKLAFFCTPNNPTGNRLDAEVIADFASGFQGLVVVDEAYIEFSGQESFTTYSDALPNIVVLQTFSKAWGMAGARLGAGFMQPDVAAVLNKVKPPYNLNQLTIARALERLQQPETMQGQVRRLVAERQRLEKNLQPLPNVKRIFPSDANFLLVQFHDAQKVMRYTQNEGIILRDRSNVPGCSNSIRITVGTEAQNDALIEILKQM